MEYTIGDKFERINQIGVGENGKEFIFNNFIITGFGKKTVFISGIIASGVFKTRKINSLDFIIFINFSILHFQSHQYF